MNSDKEQNISSTDRRCHPRFQAHERALVAVSGDDFSLPYQLIDISEGGMAVRYLAKSPLPLSDCQMDIFLDKDLRVGRLPVTAVADRQLEDSLIPIRRCGVRFGKLTPAQQVQLQDFLQYNTKSIQSSS